jgi:NAD(P)H dehydrogenase (quinone)
LDTSLRLAFLINFSADGRQDYGAVSAREPRSDEMKAACRILGRRLAEWVAVFIGGRGDEHPLVKPVVRMPPT